MLRLSLLALFMLIPCVSFAQPILFSRENVVIVSTRIPVTMKVADENEPSVTMNEENTEKKEDIAPPKENVKQVPAEPVISRHTFLTEIYPMSATNYSWFSNRQPLEQGRGIMIVLEEKDELTLGWSNTTTAYDVLFVQGNGVIHTIVPDLVLGDLADPLEISGKIRAVLYLPAGATKALDIQPKDTVEHVLFRPSPMILQ